MDCRKESLIKQYNLDVTLAESKYKFIKLVTSDQLIISKRKKADIVSEMLAMGIFHLIDGKLDYLIGMSINNLTIEKMKELQDLVKEAKAKLKLLKSKSPKELLVEDVEALK